MDGRGVNGGGVTNAEVIINGDAMIAVRRKSIQRAVTQLIEGSMIFIEEYEIEEGDDAHTKEVHVDDLRHAYQDETYKVGSIFHCPIISNIMTLKWFRQLRRYLHLTNLATYAHIKKAESGYDKMQQLRWLMNDI